MEPMVYDVNVNQRELVALQFLKGMLRYVQISVLIRTGQTGRHLQLPPMAHRTMPMAIDRPSFDYPSSVSYSFHHAPLISADGLVKLRRGSFFYTRYGPVLHVSSSLVCSHSIMAWMHFYDAAPATIKERKCPFGIYGALIESELQHM
jgi:hypothetical protein